MRKIVECVPNISEGRDQSIIDTCADAVRKVEGVTLLDVDPGKSTNRTVFTFVGDPDAVVEAAIQFTKVAKELIDMSKHHGGHPRMGAVDVVPFVPVANVTMEECVDCAKRYAKRAAEELNIPIYLYEEASDNPKRKTLSQIRAGEYEAIKDKIVKPEWKPDFGPAEFIPKYGATAAGARFFLIAYNVNILGTRNQAFRIAFNIREQGRGPDQPGRLKAVKAIGWDVEEYGMAQVTINLDNYKITPPHIAFEECKKDAKELNVGVCGSELVGLIPLEAMLMAADYYIEQENLFIIDESQKIKLVIDRLGLSSVSPFIPEKRIIEYMIQEQKNEPLASSTVRQFVEEVGSRSSAPGGGSVSALIASLGAGLSVMVAWLTYGVRKYEQHDPVMRKVIEPLDKKMRELIPMIDADTDAFNDYMNAMKMPKNSDEEKKLRNEKMQEGLKKAIDVPLSVMRKADECWEYVIEVAKYGNMNSKSDLQVGAKSLETGIWGAFKNVEINMPGIEDEDYKQNVLKEGLDILGRAKQNVEEVCKMLDERQAKED